MKIEYKKFTLDTNSGVLLKLETYLSEKTQEMLSEFVFLKKFIFNTNSGFLFKVETYFRGQRKTQAIVNKISLFLKMFSAATSYIVSPINFVFRRSERPVR